MEPLRPGPLQRRRGTAIDDEILRLGMEPSPPSQVQPFGRNGVSLNIKLSPELHNRLIQLAGNELKLKLPGVGRSAPATISTQSSRARPVPLRRSGTAPRMKGGN